MDAGTDFPKEARHFTLSLIKFCYQICGSRFPEQLQALLDEFHDENPEICSDNVKKAIVVFISKLFDRSKPPTPITRDEYYLQIVKVARHYAPKTFLEFVSWYILNVVFDNLKLPAIEFYRNIVDVLCNSSPTHIDDILADIDETAEKIFEDDLKKCMCLGIKYVNGRIDMTVEKNFILKLIDYMLTVHFIPVPEYIGENLRIFESPDSIVFTPTICSAVIVSLNINTKVAYTIGKENLLSHYRTWVFKKFTKRDFLEFCILYTRKVADDPTDKFQSPVKIHYGLLTMLEQLKKMGNLSFFSTYYFEETAEEILLEDEGRTAHEHEQFRNLAATRAVDIPSNEHSMEEPLQEDACRTSHEHLVASASGRESDIHNVRSREGRASNFQRTVSNDQEQSDHCCFACT